MKNAFESSPETVASAQPENRAEVSAAELKVKYQLTDETCNLPEESEERVSRILAERERLERIHRGFTREIPEIQVALRLPEDDPHFKGMRTSPNAYRMRLQECQTALPLVFDRIKELESRSKKVLIPFQE